MEAGIILLNRIIDNEYCYYSEKEIEELKEDEKSIFLKKREN